MDDAADLARRFVGLLVQLHRYHVFRAVANHGEFAILAFRQDVAVHSRVVRVDSGGESTDSSVVSFASFGIILRLGRPRAGAHALRRAAKRRKVGGVKLGTRIVGVFNQHR